MHRTNALTVSILSLGLFGGACTWTPDPNVNGGGAAGGGGHRPTGGTGGTGVTVDGSTLPTADANCGVTNHMGNRLPPDLLLVFDRSGSMAEDPTTGNNCNPAATCPSKWNQATTAVGMAVTASEGTIRWGLKLFSTNGNNCTVNAGAQVPIALNNGTAITTALGNAGPAGSTPTTAAVTRGGDYLATLTTDNPRFLVLVTDGQPTCAGGNGNGADDAAAVAAVATQAARGYGTFVVGIATVGNTGADGTLSMMSTNGMHARAGTPNYYVVNNTAELVTALESIGTQVSSCTFTLDTIPPNPANVRVEGDGTPIPANLNNGWVYEPGMRSITLKGSYCDNVLNSTIKSVVVLFGCGNTPIP
jgi:von Willebrand factor type A domain